MTEKSSTEVINLLNDRNINSPRGNPTMKFLSGVITKYDEKTITITFQTRDQMSNGRDQVQGGFLCAMLDASIAHYVMVNTKLKFSIATLEQKQSYFKSVPINTTVTVVASAVKMGKEIAFLAAEMFSEKGELLCNASQTCKLVEVIRKPPTTSSPKL